MMGMTKDLRKYLRDLKEQGYQLVPTHHHVKIYFDGNLVGTAGGGQSLRAIKNLQCEIRKFERQQREKISDVRATA